MNNHEIEIIFNRKVISIISQLNTLMDLSKKSYGLEDQNCYESLIKNYDKLIDIEKKLVMMVSDVDWEVHGKKKWEQEHQKKFDPALICGDG